MAPSAKEVLIAAAATAVASSPRIRSAVREGAVQGLAGAMKAGEVIAGAGRGGFEGVKSGLERGGGRSSGSG
jgi:hypothetical protein